MGRKGTEPPQNTLMKTKGLERNPREECGCLRTVQLSSMAATERDRDNQAKLVTSLGVFWQVALDVNDMKEFVSFIMEQENYSAVCTLAIYSVIINIYMLIHGIIN